MKRNDSVRNETIKVVGVSFCIVMCMTIAMMISPLSYQYEQNTELDKSNCIIRGGDDVFDEVITSGPSLEELDLALKTKAEGLPSIPYFDRFYSKEKRGEFKKARKEIYELQWERICLLKEHGQEEVLVDALEDYVGIIGYHQEEARALLNDIESNR